MVPTVAVSSNPAPKSFPYFPPRNFAAPAAFPTPAFANNPAAAAASLIPPRITILVKNPTNFPKPVPNII